MTAVERGSASPIAKVTSFGRGAAPSNALGSQAVSDITICLRPSRRGFSQGSRYYYAACPPPQAAGDFIVQVTYYCRHGPVNSLVNCHIKDHVDLVRKDHCRSILAKRCVKCVRNTCTEFLSLVLLIDGEGQH